MAQMTTTPAPAVPVKPAVPISHTGASVASLTPQQKIHALRTVQILHANNLVAMALNLTEQGTDLPMGNILTSTEILAGFDVAIGAIHAMEV